jgi:hypothetical protein
MGGLTFASVFLCSAEQLLRTLADRQLRVGRQIALPSKPVFHVDPKPLQRYSGAGLHQSICQWQGIVKYGIVREVPHRETVQPLQRRGTALAAFVELDFDFAREQ